MYVCMGVSFFAWFITMRGKQILVRAVGLLKENTLGGNRAFFTYI